MHKNAYDQIMGKRYDANERTSWKDIVTKNFIGGLMWGLGSVIGATFVLSIFINALRRLDFIPVIADTLIQIQTVMESKQ